MPPESVTRTPEPEERFPGTLVLTLATLFFVLELLTSFHSAYGHYSDEFNYIACAKRLSLGYVDHPPLAPFILAVNRALLGDSLPALRFLPALCAAVTVLLAAWVAARLGGGVFARSIAALCVVTAPLYLGFFSLFSTNCFETVLWTLMFCTFIELGRSENRRLWWLIGGLVGLAVMTKHTGVILVGAVAASLVISPMRRDLLTRHVWMGLGLALLIVLPNLCWQVQHDWASLEFYTVNDRIHNVPTSALAVFDGQVAGLNPAAFPVWAAGFFFLLIAQRGQRYRLVGWVTVLLFVGLLLAGKSRPDRVQGIYPVLFGAGAVQIELLFARRGFRWLRYVLPFLMIAVAVTAAPLLLPILGPETAVRYFSSTDENQRQIQREVGTAPLLLPLAHRLGWNELVENVADVYATLDPSEQGGTIILAEYVSMIEAVEMLGHGTLPRIYSPSLSGYLWGPPEVEPEVVIALGYEPEQLASFFETIEVVARAPCTYCMGWRQDYPIALARKPRRPFAEVWPELGQFFGRKGYLLHKADLLELPASR